jgi:hypothetical protein
MADRQKLGRWLIALAAVVGGYFLLVFDASVPNPNGGRTMNLGLMAERQNWIIVSGIVGIIGVLLILLSPATTPPEVSPTTTSSSGLAPQKPPMSRRKTFALLALATLAVSFIVAAQAGILEVLWQILPLVPDVLKEIWLYWTT